MAETVLRTEGVGKRFGGLVAVEAVDFVLAPHQLHAVIGPNGAGKSTLLGVLAGDLRASTGRIMLGQRDVTSLSVQARARLGMGRTYQRSAVIPGFTALGMVQVAAARGASSLWQLMRRIERIPNVTARARAALDLVGLAQRADVTIDMLSHGERRRVEIASVLSLEPTILLLDEPLAGLGREEARAVAGLIGNLKSRSSIVLIEHDIDLVFTVADRITVLDNGRVIAAGQPGDVRASPAVQRAYLGHAYQGVAGGDAA